MKIKAGYRISIKSWENDADNPQVIVIDGLTEDRVKYIIELIKMFKSHNNPNSGFGNLYDGYGSKRYKLARHAIMDVMKKHDAVLTAEERDYVNGDEEDFEACEIMCDYLGVSSDNFTFRVFDSFTVEFIPYEIDLEDVTSQFEKG